MWYCYINIIYSDLQIFYSIIIIILWHYYLIIIYDNLYKILANLPYKIDTTI